MINIDTTALRQRISHPSHQPLWFGMQSFWKQAAEKEAKAEKIEVRPACGSAYMTDGLMDAALTVRLTGDKEALAHVLAQVRKIAYVYRDVPASLEADSIGRTTYFSNAELCMAWTLCGEQWPEADTQTLFRLFREHFSQDTKSDDLKIVTSEAPGHNIAYTTRLAAAICALSVGEESGYENWEELVKFGADATRLFCHCGFDPDGVSLEAAMYGLAVCRWMYLFAELYMERGDLFSELPTLRKIPHAQLEMVLPSLDRIPDFGDSSHGEGMPLLADPWLLLTAQHFGSSEYKDLWLQSGGATAINQQTWQSFLWWDGKQSEQSIPTMDLPNMFSAPLAGIAVMRSSWSAQATHLTVLSQGRSHTTPGHSHADAGHFSIFSHGEHFSIDTGYWNYNEDQHSVILVNGTGNIISDERWYALQPLRGSMPRHESVDWLDYVAVEADHAKNCIWADRHFLFIRGDGDECYTVILDDVNKANDRMNILWQLQAHPDREIECLNECQARIIGDHAALDITFLNPLPTDYPTFPHQLTISKDVKKGAEPDHDLSERPRLLAEQKGLNSKLITILAPRAKTETPIAIVDQTAPMTFRAEITLGDYTDTIISSMHRGWIAFNDIKAVTELAVIRRNSKGKVLHTWTVDGAPLSIQAPPI